MHDPGSGCDGCVNLWAGRGGILVVLAVLLAPVVLVVVLRAAFAAGCCGARQVAGATAHSVDDR